MRAWALAVVLRRLRFGWGLPAVVALIAVVSCTVLSLLLLMVQNAEQGGLRASLGALPDSASRIDVDLARPSVPLAEARAAADHSVMTSLAGAATVSSTSVALSDFGAAAPLDSDLSAFAYFTAPGNLPSHATLISGQWPVPGEADPGGGTLAVAVPEPAAERHGLAVGSVFPVRTGATSSVTARVVGVYRVETAEAAETLESVEAVEAVGDEFWSADPLRGAGDVRDFPRPGVTFFDPIEAIGPLLSTQDDLDAARVPVQSFDLTYRPDFADTTTSQLAGLPERLEVSDLTRAVGNVAAQVSVSTELPFSLAEVATALTVTRSTVTITALLLALLAVTALGLAARLFAASRADDGVLARARGGSRLQVFGLASIEAAGIGALAAVAGPVLAWLLSTQQANADQGSVWPSWQVWALSGLLALVFVGVLLAPLLGRSNSAADAAGSRARPALASGIARSGLDIGIVVLAVVLYWQLSRYRSPVRGVGTLALDPILVAGPVAVLLAGALVGARLIPIVAHQLEGLARRTSGMIVTLTAWEFARRSQAATSVILLLTLCLAVGTFSQSYLATWRQSQIAQAEIAVGAPVVVPVSALGAEGSAASLRKGSSTVAPVIRRSARVSTSVVASSSSAGGDLPSGPPATVLALPENARALLARDHLAELGGSTIETALGGPPDRASGVDLPAASSGMSAVVRVAPERTLDEVTVDVRAIFEDGDGLITVLDLGRVAADGGPHTVEALLPGAEAGETFASVTRVVGVQAVFSRPESSETAPGTAAAPGTETAPQTGAATGTTITVDQLAGLTPSTDPLVFSPQPLPAQKPSWRATSDVPFADAPLIQSSPGSLTLAVSVPALLTSVGSTFTAVGWPPRADVPAVITDTLARTLAVVPGARLTIVVDGAVLGVQLSATVPFAPGASGGALLSEIGPAATATGPPAVIVVDQLSLSRALAESGRAVPLIDEWWVDVAADGSARYVAAHPPVDGGASVRSIQGLADSLQNGPLRAALPAALQLAVIAGILLAVVGFVLHTSGSLRGRRSEFAHLRAIGVSRHQVVALIAAESALLALLGSLLGVGLGIGLSTLISPLIGVSPNGAAPLPAAEIVLPWGQITALVALVLVLVAVFTVPLSAFARALDPARILRGGS